MHETIRLKWDIWEDFFGVVGDGGGGGALWGPEGGEERVNWKMGKREESREVTEEAYFFETYYLNRRNFSSSFSVKRLHLALIRLFGAQGST